jgi:hypothetical protein
MSPKEEIMMRTVAGLLLTLFICGLAVGQEKDWKSMVRIDITSDLISKPPSKRGLNQVATGPEGLKIYALVKDGIVESWQAKDRRGRKIKTTDREDLERFESKEKAGSFNTRKINLVCVEDKNICFIVKRAQ